MTRVLVGQRLDPDVGELLLDRFGHLVDEVDHRARRRALALVDRPAVRALAPSGPIVLADAEQPGLRILADACQHALGHDPHHVRVGQAELGMFRGPFAVQLAVVFRVFGEELARRHQRVEGVDEQARPETDLAAVLLLELGPISVHLAPRGEVAVEHVPPERLAHGEGRHLRLVKLRNRPRVALRDDAVMRGVPSAPAVFLQQLVDAVQRSAHRTADDQQMRRSRHNSKTVVSQLAQVGCLAEHGFRVPRDAQQDRLGRQGLIIGEDGQFGSGHLPGESLQFFGGVDLGRRSFGRPNDRELARPVGGQRQAALSGKPRSWSASAVQTARDEDES